MSYYANTEKFQCLTINPRKIDSDKQTEALQIKDQIIANTSQIKLLGVELLQLQLQLQLYFIRLLVTIDWPAK